MLARRLKLPFQMMSQFAGKPKSKEGTKKRDIHNPSLKEKIEIIKQMKPYIIPYLHENKTVTKSLLKSYVYLILSKICFFGGPLLLKKGINGLQSGLGDPLLLFLGYGVCYSASVLF